MVDGNIIVTPAAPPFGVTIASAIFSAVLISIVVLFIFVAVITVGAVILHLVILLDVLALLRGLVWCLLFLGLFGSTLF